GEGMWPGVGGKGVCVPVRQEEGAAGRRAGEKPRRDRAVEGARASWRSGNPDDISRALDELQQAYSAAGASLYAAARGAEAPGDAGAAPGDAPQDAGAGKQDNVVDADYEIVDDDKGKK